MIKMVSSSFKLFLSVSLFFVCPIKSSQDREINTIELDYSIPMSVNRKPEGVGKSPYPASALLRYGLNYITNGKYSYKNPDYNSANRLPVGKNVSFGRTDSALLKPINIIFLGDIMVSQSGNPPYLDNKILSLIKSADIIVANVESPIVDTQDLIKRKLSLRFEMPVSYLYNIYQHNPKAQWVFNIANNHAFDTSDKDSYDVSGLKNTVQSIKNCMPNSHVIGTDVDMAKSILVLKIDEGYKIGFIGWTEVMNNDAKHNKKPIVRAEDINSKMLELAKKTFGIDLLIGFPHGNEEQSYEPLKETRDRWLNITGSSVFDIIVGTGPHVVQFAEAINNRFIFHSIGNFFSPKGKSQTKVGCIPEFVIQIDSQDKVNVSYNANFIQQKEDCVSLFKLGDREKLYPDIAARLRSIWS